MIGSCKVIDFHGHVGCWDEFRAFDDPDVMLAAMDAVGIDKSCLFNIFHPEGVHSNDLTAEFIARYPERFVGFAYVSPLKPAGMVAELERAVDQLGLRAIKLYPPYTPFNLNRECWFPIYQFAHDRGLAVISHTGPESTAYPRYLAEVAPRFPGANFVAGHSGNTPEHRHDAIEAARYCPNFYLETCSTFRIPGVMEELVGGAGASKVLFGSDIPLLDPRPQLGKIITADISDEAKRLVLGENACRLLNL